ncbi:macrophage infectivity potentiator FKBP peptidyl-prolyl cis-trans isomerase-like fold [Cryptosporidium sp. chipmunk genotype I]|uniref:macrophage infectivity potentiator FKBP peptidyl-prolyl cis-trans isomerase-like fold n=1 Tax=Cryptosporidium sp. chipmunk genotype I TaxID=1280935 RepID=UPI00351A61CF|nr:macrophage infectivity potentiator FKBP peptidyl-prolyl cis-trans isomerase-like fold [Cryptosporidium sp. chipmunk genotype I]
MKSLLIVILFLAFFNTISLCSRLEWAGDEFEVKQLSEFISGSVPQVKRTLMCESCQLITFALKKYISEKLSIYKTSQPPKGFTDIVVSNFLESHVACSNHIWQPLADNSLEFTIEDFISACRSNLSTWESVLELISTSKMSLAQEISRVCLETESCKDKSELWTEQEFPENREPKYSLLKKRSDEFIAKNKDRQGVITTSSGLQYIVVKEGTGQDKPNTDDEVEVFYRGKTLGGIEFDSSFNRGEGPSRMQISQLIPAWIEALTMMTEGQEVILFVPYDLAYGEQGAGELIGPNEVIVFKLKLAKIIKSENKKPDDKDNSASATDEL